MEDDLYADDQAFYSQMNNQQSDIPLDDSILSYNDPRTQRYLQNPCDESSQYEANQFIITQPIYQYQKKNIKIKAPILKIFEIENDKIQKNNKLYIKKQQILLMKNKSEKSRAYKNCSRFIMQQCIENILKLPTFDNQQLEELKDYLNKNKAKFTNIQAIRQNWTQQKNQPQLVNNRNALFLKLCFQYMSFQARKDIMNGNFINKHIYLDYLTKMKKFIMNPCDYRKNN